MAFLYVLRRKFDNSLEFGYLAFFTRISFREFLLVKNMAGINFCKVAQTLRSSCKLLSVKIAFKAVLD